MQFDKRILESTCALDRLVYYLLIMTDQSTKERILKSAESLTLEKSFLLVLVGIKRDSQVGKYPEG